MAGLNVGWSSGILAVLLISFIVAVAARGYFTRTSALNPSTDLIQAFNSQPWYSLAASFFAAAFCASALSANPEAGFTGGWVSVFCYGLANAGPYFALIFLGPKVQNFLKMEGFTLVDFVHVRYGIALTLITGFLSVGFMFIWLTAELTSVGAAVKTLSPDFYAPAAIIAIALGVAIYALMAGFRGSILTDKIQAAGAIICLIIVSIGIFCNVPTDSEAWKTASTAHANDFTGGLVLLISTTLNQFLDLGSWQRIFASNSRKSAQMGLLSAGILNFLAQATMAFLGLYGVVATLSGSIDTDTEPADSFFKLVDATPKFFSAVALIMAVALSASTVDSLENSIASAFVRPLHKRHYSLNWARLAAIMLIIPAIVLATTDQSVLSLFLLSNIFSSAVIPPIFLGLSHKLATRLGALAGVVSGTLAVFIIGWGYEGDFVEGLKWPMFNRGFDDPSTLVTFIIVPCVSLVMTLTVSMIDIKRRPELTERQMRLLDDMANCSFSK